MRGRFESVQSEKVFTLMQVIKALITYVLAHVSITIKKYSKNKLILPTTFTPSFHVK